MSCIDCIHWLPFIRRTLTFCDVVWPAGAALGGLREQDCYLSLLHGLNLTTNQKAIITSRDGKFLILE